MKIVITLHTWKQITSEGPVCKQSHTEHKNLQFTHIYCLNNNFVILHFEGGKKETGWRKSLEPPL